MENPLVSIITCTYNRAEMLKQTMASIFAQTYRPVEIIIIDDGSTDNTVEVINDYRDRAFCYSQANKGVAAARKAGCKMAKGEYIVFQDDDDLMPPAKITCLYEALQQHPQAVFVVGDLAFMNAEGKLVTGSELEFKAKINTKHGEPLLIEDGYKAVLWELLTVVCHNTLFRKSDGERIGWFDETLLRYEDSDFFARLGWLGPIVYVPQTVSFFRTGHDHMQSENDINMFLWAHYRFLLLEKHLKFLKDQPDAHKEMIKRLQNKMLATLNRLTYIANRCERFSETINADYVAKGLPLLGMKEHLAYRWYAYVRLPVRDLLKSEKRKMIIPETIYQNVNRRTNSENGL